MSADESDGGKPMKRFYVISPEWRSTALAGFLWRLDVIHATQRVPKVGHNRIRGNPPRTRIYPTPPSIDKAVVAPAGLPINCYNQTWYDSLHDEEKRALRPSLTVYDFQIAPESTGGHTSNGGDNVMTCGN